MCCMSKSDVRTRNVLKIGGGDENTDEIKCKCVSE